MRTILVVIFLLLWSVAFASYDYESITVSSTAIGFTSSKITPTTHEAAKEVMCTLEGDQIRYRTDGTNPSSSEGHLVNTGSSIVIKGYDSILKFKAIKVTNDATLKCSFD